MKIFMILQEQEYLTGKVVHYLAFPTKQVEEGEEKDPYKGLQLLFHVFPTSEIRLERRREGIQ